MKKIILSAALVAMGFAATSCKKSYTCQCNDYSANPTKTTFTTISSANETDAATSCYAMGNPGASKDCGIMAP